MNPLNESNYWSARFSTAGSQYDSRHLKNSEVWLATMFAISSKISPSSSGLGVDFGDCFAVRNTNNHHFIVAEQTEIAATSTDNANVDCLTATKSEMRQMISGDVGSASAAKSSDQRSCEIILFGVGEWSHPKETSYIGCVNISIRQ